MAKLPLFMSLTKAAAALGVSRTTLRAAITSGSLHAKKFGKRRFYILRSDLNRWAILDHRVPSGGESER